MPKKSLKTGSQGYPVFLELVDFIAIDVTLISSAHLLGLVPFNTIATLSLLFSIFFLLFAEYIKVYQQKTKTIGLRNQKRLIFCTLLAIFFSELASMTVAEPESPGYLDRLPSPFYSAIIYWYFIPLPFLYYIRFFIFKYSTKKSIRVAIIGLTNNGLAAETALTNEYANITLDLAFYDERALFRCGDAVNKVESPFRGPVINLVGEAKKGNIDEIYIALPIVALHHVHHFLAIMSDTTVDTYIVPDLYTYSNNMSELRSIHNLQIIGIFSSPFKGAGSFIKRVEDLALGSIIMVMTSSPILATAIGIKLTSRGPVFFKQGRHGLSGQKIKVWKFRSMCVMENSDTVIQATKNGPQVTKFGSFLRHTLLDELLQFISVLQGNTLIVGPRPHAATHNEQYRKQVENYMIRHKIKPGITGLAQINGFRGEIDALYRMEKRAQYDVEYIQNWSLWLDIRIIIKTIFKGFVDKNVY